MQGNQKSTDHARHGTQRGELRVRRHLILLLVFWAGCDCAAQPAPRVKPVPSIAPSTKGGGQAQTTLPPDASPGPARYPANPEQLHARALVIDAHNDVPLKMADHAGYDFARRMPYGHTDIPRMVQGGLDAVFLSVWVNPRKYVGEKAWSRGMQLFRAINQAAGENPDRVTLARTSTALNRITGQGKIALLIGVEGAHAMGNFDSKARVIARLRRLHQLGARYMTLTWSNSNPLAGSSGDAGRARGLSALGRDVVSEMNRLGMMIDLSHVSDRTFFDVIRTSRSPVLLSHSSVRALANHPRNVTDEMLRTLKANGGAICINFYAGFLDDRWRRRTAGKSNRERKHLPRIPLSTLIRHISHAIEVAGIDHVCLGSDFDGVPSLPMGIDDVSGLPVVTKALLAGGNSEEDVRKVLGLNVIRIMAENEAKSSR